MHRCQDSELLLLQAFELLLLCLPELGNVNEKSDVNLVSMHSLFLYFDSLLIEMNFIFRYLFILLRISCM